MKTSAELIPADLRFVAQRLPKDVRELLKTHGGRLFVGGGFIRSVIAGEPVNDIDIFGDDPEWLRKVAEGLSAGRPDSRIHKTANAITLLTPGRMTIQFITRWNFTAAADLIASFDFTVCQAAVWRSGSAGEWRCAVGSRFYIDLAARRLVYTAPERDEEAGGSMLRVIKYVKRGYTIQVDSLGRVIDRLVSGIDEERMRKVGRDVVLAGLLREVDPSLVVDGMELLDDDHATETV